MALRFFLVSAVASFGLTFPAEGEIRTWLDVTQRWANGSLEQWDARCAGDGRMTTWTSASERSVPRESTRGDGAFDAAMDEMLRSFSIECSTAPTHREQVANLAASMFEPMVIGENLYTGTAYALNRSSEGLDMARLATQHREASAELQSTAVAEERGPARGLVEQATGRSDDDFEPMVVGGDLYVGVAFSLNRASEGPGLASEGLTFQAPADRGTGPAVTSRGSQLSVALRLTREAVYAWSNLLHGPAVVAITR